MARHRDIRNMDYTDEYEGYDDVYGHSMDDDYYISPSNRQFMYNREASRDSSKFEQSAEDIMEADELEELSDIDRAKLESCIEEINTTLGSPTVPKNELINLILKYKFDVELVLNAILESSTSEKEKATNAAEKDVTKLRSKIDSKVNTPFKTSFHIPKLNGFHQNLTENTKFQIPQIFNSKPNDSAKLNGFHVKLAGNTKFHVPQIFNSKKNDSAKKNFVIPNIFRPEESENDGPKSSLNGEYKTLSELVSSHLNSMSENLSDMHISNEIKESKSSPSCTQADEDWQIDLTKALKISPSIQNFTNTKQDKVEVFEIPFIDCEEVIQKRADKPDILPCNLDVTYLLKIKLKLSKKKSEFGKVICRKYKHLKASSRVLLEQDNLAPDTIKKFDFCTVSPDDFIKSHLKR